MKPADLDRAYTALCEALGRIGEPDAALFLATFAVDLMSSVDEPSPVLAAIDRAERGVAS